MGEGRGRDRIGSRGGELSDYPIQAYCFNHLPETLQFSSCITICLLKVN